jgi:hypothetical protein
VPASPFSVSAANSSSFVEEDESGLFAFVIRRRDRSFLTHMRGLTPLKWGNISVTP